MVLCLISTRNIVISLCHLKTTTGLKNELKSDLRGSEIQKFSRGHPPTPPLEGALPCIFLIETLYLQLKLDVIKITRKVQDLTNLVNQ